MADRFRPNPGHLPDDAVGRRVRVRLRNGTVSNEWPADGRGGCRWTRTGDPFDIDGYEVLS